MIRVFDILISFLSLIVLIPFFIIIGIFIKIDSFGPIFYIQPRVGLNGKIFNLIKFRTMKVNSDKEGLLTLGTNDIRVTRVGKWLRSMKVDELPQFFNVFIGDMSIVGPRPEVQKYVNLYSEEQKTILNVRPGITDPASIFYFAESDVLENASNPEETYLHTILPHKLSLSRIYILNPTLRSYFKYILLTIKKIFKFSVPQN